MRKSNKCEYTIGVNTKKKRKFLRPEQAVAEADRVNSMPHVIKKCVAYKCTKCYFFHVGRSTEDIHHDEFIEPEEIPIQALKIVENTNIPAIELLTSIEEDIFVKKVILKIVDEKEKNKEPVLVTAHDDFDWERDKRIL